MKRLSVLMLVLILLAGSALAEGRYLHVVDVSETTIMRESPRKWWNQLVQIPKDALVWEPEAGAPAENGFLRVYYAGQIGYVPEKNLQAISSQSDAMMIPMYIINCETNAELRLEPDIGSVIKTYIPLGEEVRVKRDLPGKFSHIQYQGLEGYVLDAHLDYLPLFSNIIRGASLHVPDKKGNDFVQTLDMNAAASLNELIRIARSDEVDGDCPIGAQLCLVLEDGTPEGRELKFMMPLDGSLVLVAQNEAFYRISDEYSEAFWNIFDAARGAVFR